MLLKIKYLWGFHRSVCFLCKYGGTKGAIKQLSINRAIFFQENSVKNWYFKKKEGNYFNWNIGEYKIFGIINKLLIKELHTY